MNFVTLLFIFYNKQAYNCLNFLKIALSQPNRQGPYYYNITDFNLVKKIEILYFKNLFIVFFKINFLVK